MSVDESTRLRIRQYLTELMDEAAADAMMESMPPIPWTELATKSDIARLDTGLQAVDGRLDGLEGQIGLLDQRLDAVDQRLGGVDGRLDAVDQRLGGVDGRLDAVDQRLGGVEGRLGGPEAQVGSLALSVAQTSRDFQDFAGIVSTQSISLGSRMDGVSERMDGVSERMDSLGVHLTDLGRAVTLGAATMAVMLAVFIAGTLASLVASGAFG